MASGLCHFGLDFGASSPSKDPNLVWSSLMLPPDLRSPREVVLYYEELYFSLIESGTVYPCIYPWVSAGVAIVLAYLLIDHRNSPLLKASRKERSSSVRPWADSDFQKYERSEQDSNIVPIDDAIHKHSNGTTISNGQPTELRKRAGPVREETCDQKQFPPSRRQRVFWQSYPSSFSVERLNWVLDVFTNFRGVGWTYETNGVPPPPSSVQVNLGMEPTSKRDAGDKLTSKTGIRRYSNQSELLKDVAIGIAYGYFALDAIKTIMHNDPYFWGYMDAAAPHWLPDIVRQSYHLTKMYRMLLSLYAIYTALWYIFKLGPAFFCGILGPKRVGIRGEAWMNPYDMFGAYNNVLDKGLAGWWGGWWHQIFRFGFEAPAARLLELLGIEKRSLLGKLISLFVAFFLSGCLHARHRGADSYCAATQEGRYRGTVSDLAAQVPQFPPCEYLALLHCAPLVPYEVWVLGSRMTSGIASSTSVFGGGQGIIGGILALLRNAVSRFETLQSSWTTPKGFHFYHVRYHSPTVRSGHCRFNKMCCPCLHGCSGGNGHSLEIASSLSDREHPLFKTRRSMPTMEGALHGQQDPSFETSLPRSKR
ncbi:hypothetical protein KC358_g70 [Hortaea werneckii]|nr:hypothetical protein KC358_g70 [Hortaea werneckii]